MTKPFTPLKVSAPVRRRPLEQNRGEEKRTDLGEGLAPSIDSPSPSPVQFEVWQTLRSGVDSLDLNDKGRPWPHPRRAAVARIVAEYPDDLCLKAAREAKEIAQAQDRAPNITALFEKKLRDLVEVRDAVRGGLGA